MANQILKQARAGRDNGEAKLTLLENAEPVHVKKPYVRPDIFEQRAREMRKLLEASPIPREFLKKQ